MATIKNKVKQTNKKQKIKNAADYREILVPLCTQWECQMVLLMWKRVQWLLIKLKLNYYEIQEFNF